MWRCAKCETLNDSNDNTCLICGFDRTNFQTPKTTAEPVEPPVGQQYDQQQFDQQYDQQTVPENVNDNTYEANDLTDNQPVMTNNYENNTGIMPNEMMNNYKPRKKIKVGRIIITIILIIVLLGVSAGIFLLIYKAVKSEEAETVSNVSIACEQLI